MQVYGYAKAHIVDAQGKALGYLEHELALGLLELRRGKFNHRRLDKLGTN